jgi:hypothetical protein
MQLGSSKDSFPSFTRLNSCIAHCSTDSIPWVLTLKGRRVPWLRRGICPLANPYELWYDNLLSTRWRLQMITHWSGKIEKGWIGIHVIIGWYTDELGSYSKQLPLPGNGTRKLVGASYVVTNLKWRQKPVSILHNHRYIHKCTDTVVAFTRGYSKVSICTGNEWGLERPRTSEWSLVAVMSDWQRDVDWLLAHYCRCRLRFDLRWCR